MQDNNEEEKIVDVKSTLESFIKEEEPEISQEEAIKSYVKGDKINYNKNKKKKYSTSEEEENEDDEHLKRVKKELLESLARVEELEKKIFNEKSKSNLKDIKIKGGSQKTNEKIIEQMRQKVENEKEKGRSREE